MKHHHFWGNMFCYILVAFTLLYFGTHIACAQGEVMVTRRVMAQLTRLYEEYAIRRRCEVAFGLYGHTASNGTIVIESYYVPDQVCTETTVHWEPLPPEHNGMDLVGYGHSHPTWSDSGLLSQVDLNTFANSTVSVTLLLWQYGSTLNFTFFFK